MSGELKPCPFCGATDSTDNACQMAGVVTRSFKSAIGVPAYRVERCCGASGPAKLDWMDAHVAWDRRSLTEVLPKAQKTL